MINDGLFTSKNQELRTPLDKYREWENEFHFNTDPCTTSDNPLGTKYFYTEEQDGLNPKNKWIPPVFINPPYGRELPKWVKRAALEAQIGNVPIVMLIPARTDTRWIHDYIYYGKATEIRFLKGRLVFGELKKLCTLSFNACDFQGELLPDMTEPKAPRLVDLEPVDELQQLAKADNSEERTSVSSRCRY